MTEALFLLGAFVAFGALEAAWPARPQRLWRRELLTDGAFYVGQVVLFNGLIVAALAGLARVLAGPLGGLHAAFGQLPAWARVALVIAACDVGIYWFHRLEHRASWLWRFHRVHHTAETLDWLAAFREHPVDGLLTRLVENLPAIVLGVSLEGIAGFVAFRGLWGLVIHANLGLRFGPLEWLVGAPRLHHWHHERALGNACNFANLSPLMDRLFGTFHDPPGVAPQRFGIDDAVPRSYAGLLLSGVVPDGPPAPDAVVARPIRL